MSETEKARIMIIEDESIIAKDIENILRGYGYDVVGSYAVAEEALRKIKVLNPDVILMDIVLRGSIDGIDAAQIIKDKYSVPVIFITAYDDEKTVNKIKNTEPYGYFLKPFEERQLHTCIENTIYKFRSDQMLRKSEHWMSAILNSIGEAVIATDENGKVKFLNPVAEALTGWKHAEAMGSNVANVLNITNAEAEELDNTINKVIDDGVAVGSQNNSILNTKNGRKVNISYCKTQIKDEYGENNYGAIYVVRDLTEQKRYENGLKKLTEKLVQSNKDLEQFAYIASHDLQEPLRMVSSYVQLLQKKYSQGLDPEANEFIAFAVEGVNRMKNLINDLLTYSRVTTQSAPFEKIDLNEVVHKAVKNLQNSIHLSGASIIFKDLPVVTANSSQINQVMHNLISNALKFNRSEKPEVEITCERKENEFQVAVKDNGIGIDSNYANKVFVIFQRLHNYSEYPGTGLGLAICKKIVVNNGGRIWFESEPNGGSTFYFTIPYHEQNA